MFTIPNQSSVPKAYLEFDEDGRMKPFPFYDRITDVMEELMKFTLLLRDRTDYLTGRYSERKESAEALSKRVNMRSIQTSLRYRTELSRFRVSACTKPAKQKAGKHDRAITSS